MSDEVGQVSEPASETPAEAPQTEETAVTDENTPVEGEAGSEESKELSFEDRMDELLKANPRTIKVNGRERQVSSWAEWERYAAREMSAEDRFQEAKKMREEAEELKKVVENGDILELLRKRGLDQEGIKKALGDVVQKLVEDDEMDPRDRRIKELEAAEEARKAEIERQKAEKEANERKATVDAEAKRYIEEISESAERLGLTAEPFLLQQVATELASAYDDGYQMSVDDAVRVVRDRFVGDFANCVQQLPLDLKKQIFGEEALKELQNEAVANAKAGRKPSKPADARKDSAQADEDDDDLTEAIFGTPRKKEEARESMDDFFASVRNTYR